MKKTVKIGIDASSVSEKFGGGKEKVLMNLLMGLYERGSVPVVFCRENAYEKIAEACPIAEIVIIHMPLNLKLGRIIKNILLRTFILPGKVARSNIDLLLFPAPLTGFAKFGCRTVVIPHDIQFKSNPEMEKGFKLRIIGWLYGIDFNKRDAIISISNYDRDEIANYYSAFIDKIKVIYNPIDFGETAKSNIKNEKQYIFANNLMHVHKNLDVLLEAFDHLIKKGWEGKLVITGRIYYKNAEVRAILKAMIESGRVKITGYVSDEKMKELITGATIFVNPSSFEGFGMSAVEAMGLGIPCVLADNSAVREVTLGRACYYSPAEDKNTLAEVIADVLNNPPSDSFLAETAKMIRDCYDYRQITEEYIAFLEELGSVNG